MNIEGDVQKPLYIEHGKTDYFYIGLISNSQSLRVLSTLGEEFDFFSLLRFDSQRDSDHEISQSFKTISGRKKSD